QCTRMGRLFAILMFVPFLSESGTPKECFTDPPDYYAINLVSTRRLPGTRMARGVANVTFAASPYGVNISPEGTYVYDLSIEVEGLKKPTEGVYVAWLTRPDLSEVVRLGPLDELDLVEGRVHWNKFLVVISLEESDDSDQERWQGPIAFRGLSRSGLMHTMAGHGPFDQEPCASFGFE
ncbi:MAG: hypothetical protein ACC655_08820, partial [Rhodothermia bacterium]